MAIDKVGAVGGAGASSPLGPSAGADFGKVLEGVKGSAASPGPPVATEGAPGRASPEVSEAVRGTCEARVGATTCAGRTRVDAPPGAGASRSTHASQAVQMLDRVSEAQKRLDQVLALAESGRSFSPAELLAVQAHVYRASQELELAGKVVEKATGGVKQVLQTQV